MGTTVYYIRACLVVVVFEFLVQPYFFPNTYSKQRNLKK